MTLTEIFNSCGSDKGDRLESHHNYTPFYESFLHTRQNDPLLILEIGVFAGSSLAAWYKYFPNSTIIGLDIDDKTMFDNDRIHTFRLDQSSHSELENFVTECKKNGYEFDFILDDGSHHMKDQQITLGYLFPLLKSKGVYFIEDLHTSLADDGFVLYSRGLEIQENRKNTTLYYLMESFDSTYLNKEQNSYLQENIDIIHIHNRFNPYQEKAYKNRSITSAILKK
jgi:hypothetical protein